MRVALRKIEQNLDSATKGATAFSLEDHDVYLYFLEAAKKHPAEVLRWALESCKSDLAEAREGAKAHARMILEEIEG